MEIGGRDAYSLLTIICFHLPSLGHVDLSIDHFFNHHLERFWFSINEPRRVGEYR